MRGVWGLRVLGAEDADEGAFVAWAGTCVAEADAEVEGVMREGAGADPVGGKGAVGERLVRGVAHHFWQREEGEDIVEIGFLERVQLETLGVDCDSSWGIFK